MFEYFCYISPISRTSHVNTKMTAMNRVAILVRVSKADQSYDRQVTELTEYAASREFKVIELITETVSGSKKNSERKGIQRLLRLAESRKINKVLVHEVTRLGRDTAQVLATMEALHALQVSVVVKNYSIETLNPDGSVNAMAQFLLTILADIGRMERITLIERVKSGLEEARRKGKVLGRPQGSTKDLVRSHPKVVRYLQAGQSIRETAKLCGVGVSTVQRVKKALTCERSCSLSVKTR
ncbi:recombinase family protein [Pontibacter chinhatensis]|uniref:Site-specific DNA recombinase n=1 Tax=Pontibacter chinhatensis TaxID=1436961 RepID=A0A1I2VDD3_9BACT|nr:recombinase family protein [Pontibacter chinhatensis]SFG87364.1 Site-specific DNA recombinase [Pontibacter chinhatensis]